MQNPGGQIRNHLIAAVIMGGLAFVFSACALTPAPHPPTKEARGVWLHRFEYCEVTPTHDQDSIRAYIADVINHAADANFNIIFFQVRGNGDAYYMPGLEPWGNLLTGTLGEDPGWDPLDFALELAHARGLELHAWFNTFPAWRGRKPPPKTAPLSPYLTHPEWIVSDSSGTTMPLSDHYISFSPGIPGVHQHITAVVLDVVRRYDIDGVHF
ncbi:MAG: family 10 glycosylhydrolase, partial [Fidelibacterota bacterium]